MVVVVVTKVTVLVVLFQRVLARFGYQQGKRFTRRVLWW